MISIDPRWQQLRVAFGVELEERVRALNRLLLDLERNNDDPQHVAETFESLFREAHSLKGAARAVEFSALEELAHTLETALTNVRQASVAPTTAWFDVLYSAADLFGPLYQAAMSDVTPPPELHEVLASLRNVDDAPDVVATIEHPAFASEVKPHSVPFQAENEPELLLAVPDKAPQAEPMREAPLVRTGSDGDVAARTSVRVAVNKLDVLLSQVGELAVTHIRIERRHSEFKALRREFSSWRRDWRTRRGLRAQIRQAITRLDKGHASLVHDIEDLVGLAERSEQRTAALLQQVEDITLRLRDDLAGLGLVAQSIESEVMAVRLMPVSTIFAPFERMVRDLARTQSKDIRLVVEGGETEIDRKILEQLRDPLIHMLRNAIDHGIEVPARRQQQGKPQVGTLRLSAVQRSGMVEIELEDDGAGIDPARVREVAVAKSLLTAERALLLDDQAALELIFKPGFSTTTIVTETSGRGVGMDIVRANIEHLDGRVRLTSVRGKGTHFIISLPLTLATTRALLVEQSGTTFAVPTSTIVRSARVQENQVWSIEGRRVIQIDGTSVPVLELADVLELPRDTSQAQQEGAWRPVFVLRQDGHKLAFLINQLVGEQEVVIKSLGWPLQRVRNVGGVAVLGSGETTVILNPADLFKTGLKLLGAAPGLASPSTVASQQRRQCVLVVDDSLTTRTLERSILESAGYTTVVASDGIEALAVLRSEQIDLVVSDIEMPRLDGFGLTAQIRHDERLRQIPVVLVTSLEAREHRERGVEVGADAYIVKSGFDQNLLLQTIGRLL